MVDQKNRNQDILQKQDEDSEGFRVADWTIQCRVVKIGNDTAFDACLKLKLWQLVGLYLKRSPFESHNGANDTESEVDEPDDDGSEDYESERYESEDYESEDDGSEEYESAEDNSEDDGPDDDGSES